MGIIPEFKGKFLRPRRLKRLRLHSDTLVQVLNGIRYAWTGSLPEDAEIVTAQFVDDQIEFWVYSVDFPVTEYGTLPPLINAQS